MTKNLKNTIGERYIAPSIEIDLIEVEQGFAVSANGVPGFNDPAEAFWNPYGYEEHTYEI